MRRANKTKQNKTEQKFAVVQTAKKIRTVVGGARTARTGQGGFEPSRAFISELEPCLALAFHFCILSSEKNDAVRANNEDIFLCPRKIFKLWRHVVVAVEPYNCLPYLT